MTRLGLEFISVMGMPPVPYVELAAELGAPHVSFAFMDTGFNPFGYAPWSLREDSGLRRELKAALAANGVAISHCENLSVQPGVDKRDQWLANLELYAELGAGLANSVSFESDPGRNVEQYGRLVELAAPFGIRIAIEFVPWFGIADLPAALAVIEEVAHRDLLLTVDTMHAGRSGVTARDLRAIAPGTIGHVQLCDVPLAPPGPGLEAYRDEAVFDRKVPGEGELPLCEYLAAMPLDCVVGLEVPLRAEALRGISSRESLARAVAATRRLLAQIEGERT